MGNQNPPLPPRDRWAYGYEISNPMTRDRLKSIELLLAEEHSQANLETRTWQGRFVVEEQVTHILVVSDSPDQQLEVNRRLETELKKVEAAFLLTPAMPVGKGENRRSEAHRLKLESTLEP